MLNVHGKSEKAKPIKHDLEQVSKLASTEKSIKLTEEEETFMAKETNKLTKYAGWGLKALTPIPANPTSKRFLHNVLDT